MNIKAIGGLGRLWRRWNLIISTCIGYWGLTFMVNVFWLLVYDYFSANFFGYFHSPLRKGLWSEWVLTLGLLAVFHWPVRRWIDWFAPALLIIGIWGAIDYELYIHKVVPTWSAIEILWTFRDFMGPTFWGLIAVGVIIVLALLFWWFWGVRYWLRCPRAHHWAIGVVKIVAIGAIGLLFAQVDRIERQYQNAEWDFADEVSYNGRFTAFLVHSWRQEQIRAQLQAFTYSLAQKPEEILFPGQWKHRPNVYFILLEGFTDPRWFTSLTFEPSPIHSAYQRVVGTDTFKTARSPVVGGFTAQTTFEILTGLPARQRLASVEFLVMDTFPTFSLVRRLKAQGYYTALLEGARSIYFNEPRAYRSLGFDTIVFWGDRFEATHILPDDTVYKWALQAIAHMPNPRFVMIVTMYGHWPWEINPVLGPDSVHIQPDDDPDMHYQAQFAYYRTRALARFLERLWQIDSSALVLYFSDHQPPFLSENRTDFRYSDPHLVPYYLLLGHSDSLVRDIPHALRYYELSRWLYARLAHQPWRPLADSLIQPLYMGFFRRAQGLAR